MKIFFLTSTYLVGIGELILAIYFWVTNSRNEIRRVMALLAFSTGAWVVCSAFAAYRPESPLMLSVNRSIYVFGVFLITALLHLAIIFPYPTFRFDRVHGYLIYFPAAVFSFIALFTKTVVEGITQVNNAVGKLNYGEVTPIINIFIFLVFILSIILLVKKYKKVDGFLRQNILFFVLALILGGLPALYVDIIFPTFSLKGEPNFLIGVMGSGLWLFMTAYIISRRD